MAPANPIHPTADAANICLIGLMGSGKSTVGPLLADQLNYTLVDLDSEIVTRLGRAIPEIFERLGEAAFRHEEARLLKNFCAEKHQVIDCGGGVVVTPENRPILRQQTTVYLAAGPETLARRVGSGKGRPLLKNAHSMIEHLAGLLRERELFYRESAAIIIETDHKKPRAIAREILTGLNVEQKARPL